MSPEGQFYMSPHSVGGDNTYMVGFALQMEFQSAPPRGGRPERRQHGYEPQTPDRFNPRPRVGGDEDCDFNPVIQDGFNPRPRVGATGAALRTRHVEVVSIRAPACVNGNRKLHTFGN